MKDKFSKFSLPLIWIFAFIIIIFMITLTSHAESYFPMQQNENNTLTSNVIDFINSDTQINIDNNYVVVGKTLVVGNYTSVYVLTCSKENNYIFAEKLSNGYQFSYYLLNGSNGSFNVWEVKYRTSNPTSVFKNNATSGGLTYFINLDSSLYNSNVSYVSNLKVYTNSSDNRELVLKYGQEETPIDIGVAIIPPDAFVPDYPSGTTPPTQVPPTFSSSDYNWTTPPTFDGSSVTNAIGSIQNILGWIANNLKEEFKNLTNNLKGFFKYIGDTIQYYCNAIIETLNNFIQNFYDNMANLVQPIFDKISYITEPIDSDSITDAFNQNALISVQNDFVDFLNDFDYIIRNTQEPDTFDITINIQNVRTFYNFGCRSPVILHLGNNLNGTTKNIFRAFLWVLVIVGSIFLTEKNLSVWIKGGGFSVK